MARGRWHRADSWDTLVHTSVQTTGWDAVWERFNKHKSERSAKNMGDAAKAAADFVHGKIVSEMNLNKTGARGVRTRASLGPVTSPTAIYFEFPAVQSGQLVSNLSTKRGPATKYKGEAYLEARGKHAFYMEYGFTAKNGVTHYRPFMRAAVVRWRDAAKVIMRNRIKK